MISKHNPLDNQQTFLYNPSALVASALGHNGGERMDFDATRPIYLQIIDLHKRALITGELSSGDKILSQRDFAQRYNVNLILSRAYREMEALDLVETLRGQGTFIAVTEEMLDTMKKDTAKYLGQFCPRNENIRV